METRNAIEGTVHPSETQEQSRVDTLINQRMGPGMVVLAPPMRVLHINQHAWELIRRITHVKDGHEGSKRTMGLLPTSIRQIGTRRSTGRASCRAIRIALIGRRIKTKGMVPWRPGMP